MNPVDASSALTAARANVASAQAVFLRLNMKANAALLEEALAHIDAAHGHIGDTLAPLNLPHQ